MVFQGKEREGVLAGKKRDHVISIGTFAELVCVGEGERMCGVELNGALNSSESHFLRDWLSWQ
jgi:hypothetical protein